MKQRPYCPRRGDVVWLSFQPQAGHRPALALTPESYNRKVGLALFCPITTRIKGYSFEVEIPPGHEAAGAILTDHIRSLDWQARNARFFCRLPDALISEVRMKLEVLIG